MARPLFPLPDLKAVSRSSKINMETQLTVWHIRDVPAVRFVRYLICLAKWDNARRVLVRH